MSKLPTGVFDNEKEMQFVARLFEREYDELHRYLLARFYNDEDEVSECIGQIYETAQKKAHELYVHSNIKGWLYKTAQLCAKHRWSSRRKQLITVPLDCFIDTLSYEQPIYDESPDSQTIEAAKNKCLSVLTQTERVTYELFYEKQFSVKQITEQTGVSESAICVRLHRLRIKLIDAVKNAF